MDVNKLKPSQEVWSRRGTICSSKILKVWPQNKAGDDSEDCKEDQEENEFPDDEDK